MRYPLALVTALCMLACRQEPAPTTSISDETDKSTIEKFFPVADYLEGEVAYVDSLPVGIRQYSSGPAGEDSAWMDRDSFHRLTAGFLLPEIEEKKFEQLFEERSFFDKGSGTSTFFYSAKSDSLTLRRVDVVTAPGDVYDEVKSIYLEKRYRAGDTAVVERMIWKPKRNFQIIRQSGTDESTSQTHILKVVWDNRE